jgi:hypothetical protein
MHTIMMLMIISFLCGIMAGALSVAGIVVWYKNKADVQKD